MTTASGADAVKSPWEVTEICGAHGLVMNEVVHCTVWADIDHSLHIGTTLTHVLVTWTST